jgi:peptidoglycan/xylan/chitin deacetylase (PgdA/CDA1 family)
MASGSAAGKPRWSSTMWAEAGLAAAASGVAAGALATFHPRLAWFGPVTWRGARSARGVALTFDDGPHPEFTPRIADVLARHDAKATFFCVGQRVEAHPDLVRALVAHGHAVENHTYRHGTGLDLFSADRLRVDLVRCQTALQTAAGVTPRFYRPAVGIRNPPVHAAAAAVGLTVVTWTHAARDGVWRLSPERALALAARCRRGDILALHDGTLSERRVLRATTVSALDALLRELKSRGLACLTLPELLPVRPRAER